MGGFSAELVLLDRDVLFVAPAPEAAAKIERLLDAGARVTLVAEGELEPDLRALTDRVHVEHRRAALADLQGKALAFLPPWSTPEDEARARQWHALAIESGTLLCTLDRPETCTFTNVGVVRASGITVTFSSGGHSPGLVRRIREDLEALFVDPRFARFVGELRALRETLPRGQRAARMAEAVSGFAIRASLVFPSWFERDEKRSVPTEGWSASTQERSVPTEGWSASTQERSVPTEGWSASTQERRGGDG